MQSPKRGVTHHWVGLEPDPDKYYGFLYIITNNVTGKKYIGRKFYHMYRKRKKFKESNWRTYTGSCKPLNEDIKKLGKANFTFEIFRQYITRGNVVYYECNYQHKFDVLTAKDENGERLWYNGNIGAIKFIPADEMAEETKRKISEANTGKPKHNAEAREKISKAGIGRVPPNRGERHAAMERGDKYYTSVPCKRGHTKRITSSGACWECRRIMRNKK